MKPRFAAFSVLVVLFLLILSGSAAAQSPGTDRAVALGSAFSYQGRLSFSGSVANGAYDFQFYLYDALSGGSQVGSMIPVNDLALTDGYFTVNLDFGSGIFTGQKRYLEVRVRPGSQTGSYTTLMPRQELSAAPNALYALSAPWSGLSGVPAGFADSIDNDTTYTAGTGLTLSSGQFSLTASYSLPQNCTSNQVAKWNGSAWICAADESGTGGSSWSLTGNAGSNPATNYLGTSDNTAFVIRVNALRALRLEPLANGNLNLLGGYNLNTITSGVLGATLFGGGYYNPSSLPNKITDSFGTVGGGMGNQAGNGISGVDDAVGATVCGGVANDATGYEATVCGGVANTASGTHAAVAGGYYNTASGENATVGGGSYNSARAAFATISGGGPSTSIPEGFSTFNNRVYDNYGTIGGGGGNRVGSDDSNIASAPYATIGGGKDNKASGVNAVVAGGFVNYATGDSAFVGGGSFNVASGKHAAVAGGTSAGAGGDYSFVGGGGDNKAGGTNSVIAGGFSNDATGSYATIGGGNTNQATNQAATVAGGWVNTASGNASTVPGGANNEATGAYSFASGADAHATHDGSFVWSSASRTDSWGVQTFTVRSPGGTRFYSTAGATAGAVMPAGGGGFSTISDRAAKENFSPVNTQALLGKIASLPITTWNYKTQAQSIRHIGPVAQDFYSAFGMGEDEKYISSVDADGVALAAIQGLYQQNQELAAEVKSLKAQLSDRGTMVRAPTMMWAVIALLAISQLGMFAMLLRRKAGRG